MFSTVGILLWASSLASIHPYTAGQIGLLPDLSPAWWAGLVLVTAAVISELRRRPPRPLVIALAIGAFALVLHGTLPAVETTPRFSAAYEIAGFAQYVEQHGRTLPYLDARMSWPGMMSAAGLLGGAMGVPALWFARWAPLVLNLLYLVPLKAIADATLRTTRAQWAALPVFLAANWIDQDYFSPQAVGLLLYLVALALVVRSFPANDPPNALLRRVTSSSVWAGTGRRIRSMARLPSARPGEPTPDVVSPRSRLALSGLAVLLTLAMVVAHQFTPLALVAVLFCLTLVGRVSLRWLWLLALVVTFAWLSWEARIYWAGHLSVIFGNIGNAGALLGGGVTGRVQGVPGGRLVVQWARLAATGLTLAGAGIGFVALWRRGRSHWTMALLIVAPALVALGVNYGGEIFLRILLFSLAPCAVLVAGLIDARSPGRRAIVVGVAVFLLLTVAFPLTRYGNEAFEAIAPSDVAAAQWATAHIRPGSVVWAVNTDNPLIGMSVGRLRVAIPDYSAPASHPRVVPGDWIYLSRSQDQYAASNQGSAVGATVKVILAYLLFSRSARIVHRTATAYVLRVVAPLPRPTTGTRG